MASRKRRKSRSKAWIFTLGPVTWLWIFAIVNFGAGLWFSPITAPRKVVAIGMRKSDLGGAAKVMEQTLETPWLRLNVFTVGGKLSRPDWVESVEFSPNIFGRAELKMKYRQPVAKVVMDRPIYLDDRGNLYYDPMDHKVPKIQLPADYLKESACITGTWPRVGVLETVKMMRSRLPQSDYSLELDGKSVLSLDITNGPKVILGPAREMSKKMDVLVKVLNDKDQNVGTGTILNLTSPTRPVRSSR